MATIGGENVVVHDDAAQIPSIWKKEYWMQKTFLNSS
jgi:hypothetical protein